MQTRRTLARSWATILKAIETAYNPTYDPNDRNNVPFLCAPLPVAFVAPSCATPDKISDPKIRAQYVAAIDENNRKKQRLEYYLRVKHLDDQARSMLDMSLKIFNEIAPDDVGPDGAALESIFRSAGISARRLGQLHGMVYARAASRTNQIGL